MKDTKNIEDFLGEQFDDFDVRPSGASFNQFMEKLEAEQKKKKRRGFYYLLITGLAALLVVLLGLWFYPSLQAPQSSNLSLRSANNSESASPGLSLSETGETPLTKTQPGAQQLHAAETSGSNTNHSVSASRNLAEPANTNNVAPSDQQLPGTSGPIDDTRPQHKNDPSVAATSNQSTVLEKHVPNTLASLNQGIIPEQTNMPAGSEVREPAQIKDTRVQADVLKPYGINFSSALTPKSDADQKLANDVRGLQTLLFKPRFFMGLSLQTLLSSPSYAANKGSELDGTGYSEDFAPAYLAQREQNKSNRLLLIPGIKFGLAYRRIEFHATVGYYQLSDREKVMLPPDTNVISLSSNTVPLNPLGGAGSGGNSTTNLLSAQDFDLADGDVYLNKFRYFYGSIGASAVFRYFGFQLKPGLNVAYNRVTSSDYLLVGTDGYRRVQQGTIGLNPQVLSLSVNCLFSKRLGKAIEFQAGPVYRMALSSVFHARYFHSQTYQALGLEAAFVYRFPVSFK